MKIKRFIFGASGPILWITPITLSTNCGNGGKNQIQGLAFGQDDFSIELKAGFDKNAKLASEVKETDFDIKSKNGKYSYEFESLTPNDQEGKLVVKYKQFDKNFPNKSLGLVSKELDGFKLKTTAVLKLNHSEADLKVELNSIINKTEKLASEILNTNINLISVNSKYTYIIKELIPNNQEGKLTMSIEQFDKNHPGDSSGIIQKIIEGFKLSKIEKVEDDLTVALSNSIDKSKTSSIEIKEKDLTASSKSNKYSYKFIGITTDDENGKLTVKYEQFDQQHQNDLNSSLGEVEFVLEGFQKVKKYGEAVLSDELSDSTKKFKAIQKIRKNLLEYSDSMKAFGYFEGRIYSQYFFVLDIRGDLKNKIDNDYEITSLENQIIDSSTNHDKKMLSGKVTTNYDYDSKKLIIKYKLAKKSADAEHRYDVSDQTIYYITVSFA